MKKTLNIAGFVAFLLVTMAIIAFRIYVEYPMYRSATSTISKEPPTPSTSTMWIITSGKQRHTTWEYKIDGACVVFTDMWDKTHVLAPPFAIESVQVYK